MKRSEEVEKMYEDMNNNDDESIDDDDNLIESLQV